MRPVATWTWGVACGATLAWILDPARGHRRRRRLQDAGLRLGHKLGHAFAVAGRDIGNRTRGIVADSRRLFRAEHPDDVILKERVRAALGHVTARSHVITVHVHNGNVVLDGPIPDAGLHRLIAAVRAVGGVADVETRFDRHILPARVPPPTRRRSEPRKMNAGLHSWPPATRTLVGGTGAVLVSLAALRRGRTGLGLAAAGAALVARSLRQSRPPLRAQKSP